MRYGTRVKYVSISEFLTDAEVGTATKLYNTVPRSQFAKLVADTIIRPNIERINQALGQENDPLYLAYAVEYALMQTSSTAAAE